MERNAAHLLQHPTRARAIGLDRFDRPWHATTASMPTQFISGDLFHHEGLQAIAHGCNCEGAMGKGIALEFRKRYPEMYTEYRTRCADGRFALGEHLAAGGPATRFKADEGRQW